MPKTIQYNDEPTLQDRLNRTNLVEEIGDIVASCALPQVIGVHGGWGIGKTSFLQQLQWYLVGKCPHADMSEQRSMQRDRAVKNGVYKDNIVTVWFEAWRYQYEPVPVVALLHEMRVQMDWQTKLDRGIDKALSTTVRGALLSLEDLTKKVGFQMSKFEKASGDWERRNLAESLPSHTIRDHIEKAIDQLLRPKDKMPERRLVVLVDDLDRCEGEAAYHLLEGLKIYLSLRNCVFILGMNQQIIENSFAEKIWGLYILLETCPPSSRLGRSVGPPGC